MFFALGLLTAGLLALLVTPAIWRRAMRLTRARIEASLPMTRAEIAAEKDQLRAGFAVANRRLEIGTTELRDKLAAKVIEVGRRRDEIAALVRSKGELAASIAGLEARAAELGEALAAAEKKLAEAEAGIAQRDATIAGHAAVLAEAEERVALSEQATEEQRLELVARATEIGNLTDSLAALTEKEAATAAARDQLAAALAAAEERTATAEAQAAGLAAGMSVLNDERAARKADLDRRAAEIHRLEEALAAAHSRSGEEITEAEKAREREEREALAAEVRHIRTERDRLAAELAARAADIGAANERLAAQGERQQALQAELAASAAALAAANAEAAAIRQRHEADAMAEGDNFRKAMAAIVAEKEELEQQLLAANEDAVATQHALSADLAARTGELADLRRELQDASAAGGDHARRLAEAETALRRAESAAAETAERHRAEIFAITRRLTALEADHAALLRENAELRRVGGPEWESEREENRRLGERLHEIALSVGRIAQPHAPSTGASEDDGAAAAALPAPSASDEEAGDAETPATLAERVRALQHAGARP